MFYDIVDSTSLLSMLDPEEFADAQRAIHTTVASIIQRYDGYLDQIAGDGGCAFFGYPVATEDAAEAAVNAALEIIQRCRNLEQASDKISAVPMRIGLATGTVVVNSSSRVGLPGGVEIIGLAVNLAARLQTLTAPDSVLVSETTHRLTHSAFHYRFVDNITVKGFSEPQPVWQPLEKRELDSRFETRRRADTPLVARVQEIEVGLRCWSEVEKGTGRILFLTGEAGIGKSRLVSELSRHVDRSSCDRRLFQCQPRGNRRPFHALIDRFIREIRHFTGSEEVDNAAVRAYLAKLVPDVRQESIDSLCLLAEVSPGRLGGDMSPIDVPGQQFSRAAIGAMIDVLSAWSARKPQFIILEDYQWADALTKSLVAELARGIGGIRALLVVSSREPVGPDLTSCPGVVVQDLARLSSGNVAQLVEEIWKPHPVPQGLSHFIEARSEGVPLFVEELAYLLKDRFGSAHSTKVSWETMLVQEGVSTLKDLLLARIAGMNGARRIAQIASVIGREFLFPHLVAIAGGMPHDTIASHLESLVANNVVHPAGGEGERSFRFRHVLFQEAAYDSLLKSEQRELHRRIVAASKGSGSPQLSDDVLAWHCERAGLFQEATQYAIRAAEGCAIRSAMHEAYQLLASAETCLSRVTQSSSTDDLMLRLLATRGPVEMALYGSGSREARRTYEEAIAICRGKGPTDREQWFPLYWGWWITSPNSEAVARSQVIVSDLEKTSDPEIRLQALHCSWATHFHAGNHLDCLRCIDQGLRLYDRERAVLNRTKYGGHDAKVCGLAERGQSLWFRGDRAAAAKSVEAALHWAEEINHLGSICHALDVALIFNHFEKNGPEVLRLSARMRELAVQYDLPNCEAKADIFSGWALALQGHVTEGRGKFERGLKHQLKIGTEEDLPLYMDMRAATLECEGRDDLALRAIEEALEYAKRTSDVFWLPELYRRRAALGEQCGRSAVLVRLDLERALSLAVAQGAETIAQRVRDDLQRLDQG
ncbi:adenylate/guanylate cyclase domain-containing protein [Microvirga sp. VF16]|uniref:ATP-binding protein n=1 Tax=Microvirga sp. VF16 TaxID=2807101 RepID=UPI00193E1EF1|nr:adenylate/guanylate cyclase domain-containing protein [Microvirga sp. VF16]QRM29961.1 AAA family ATPase [Microvirga sp. VF16]